MKSLYLFIFLIFFTGVKMPQEAANSDLLKQQIINELKTVKGEYAVVYKNLKDTSDFLFINEHKLFHAASTMKTAVMIEAFRQAQEAKLSLNDSITVKNEFKSIVNGSPYSMDLDRDSGESLYETIGKNVPLINLIHEMITVSSNLATNLIIDLIGAENVQKTIESLGVKNMKVLRGVEDMKAFDKGLNNIATAYDLMILFEHISEGTVISQAACDSMTAILTDQKFNNMIPALLPTDVKVAHKTGSISGIQHDSGFIILPNGTKYILVILWSNLEDNNKAISTGAKVSKMIYDYVTKNSLTQG